MRAFAASKREDSQAMNVVAISIGAVLGANLRYALGAWIADHYGAAFPLATLVVNVSGSFAIGLLLAVGSDRFADPAWVRPMLAIGFLGSYTTFSTFSFETLALAREGAWLAAASNVGLSVGASLAGVLLGTLLARAL